MMDWPKSTNPKKREPDPDSVAIIMPVRSNLKFTRLAFYSIRYFTDRPYMMVFVNNQSNLETKRALIGISKNHQVWFHDQHYEFNKAKLVNFGLKFCFENENVRCGLIIDNDCVVGPEWLSDMMSELQSANVGIVTRFSSSLGSCMLFRREVFEDLGGFDEELAIFEDQDFCLRAEAGRWDVVESTKANMIHFGQMTIAKMPNLIEFKKENYNKLMLKHPVKEVANV